MKLDYCCVGSFEVFLDEEKNDYHKTKGHESTQLPPLQWILHDVTPPDELCTLEMLLSKMSQSDYSTTNSFPITYPVIERTTLHLCDANLVVDDRAKRHSVSNIETLALTGVHAAGSGGVGPQGDREQRRCGRRRSRDRRARQSRRHRVRSL